MLHDQCSAALNLHILDNEGKVLTLRYHVHVK